MSRSPPVGLLTAPAHPQGSPGGVGLSEVAQALLPAVAMALALLALLRRVLLALPSAA